MFMWGWFRVSSGFIYVFSSGSLSNEILLSRITLGFMSDLGFWFRIIRIIGEFRGEKGFCTFGNRCFSSPSKLKQCLAGASIAQVHPRSARIT